MDELFRGIQDIFLNLFNSQALMEVLGRPHIMVAGFIALCLIVFTETGLLVGFFLPGDSLLVTAGIVAWGAGWPVHLLIPLLFLAAIAGNSTGYLIGYRIGPRLFTKEDSWLFRKSHIEKAHAFYAKHGGKTIIIAQFIPIMRTFAPVVAGVGRMDYRRFISFNVIGAMFWVTSMILLGYALTPLLDPLLRPIFGEGFRVQKHIEKVIIVVVLLSISPGLYAGFKHWVAKRRAAKSEPTSETVSAEEPAKPTA
jgi:membrane-associated protein